MKRKFFRSLAALMASCMFVLLGSGFTFAEKRVVVEEYVSGCCADTEIIFEDIDCEQTMQLIAATLNDEILMSPASIFCIFGHSITNSRVKQIEHRFWAAAPRCRETVFDVRHCTRSGCNFITHSQISQVRISCCA